MKINLNLAAESAYYILRAIGGTVYVVGGAVRDTLMGQVPNDIDLLVTGIPASVLDRSPHFFKTGESFGIYRHRKGDFEVEVALPRTEVSTGPLHKDFDVRVSHDISVYEDLRRRDFTCNAMAVNIGTNEFIDPHGGENDARGGIIRAMGSHTFMDDPLRIMRAFVLIARFDMAMTMHTASLITQMNASIQNEPAERIQTELDKIFEAEFPHKAMLDMQMTGVLSYIFPEVADNWDYNQNNPHHENRLGVHHLMTLKHIESISDDPDIRLAGFLHDVGKAGSRDGYPVAWIDPQTGSNHFYQKRFDQADWIRAGGQVFPSDARWVYDPMGNTQFDIGWNHEEVSADMVKPRLTTLKYPTARIDRIVYLVRHHMWAPFTTERGARKFLNKHGDFADDLLILRFGDNGGKTGYHPHTPDITLDDQKELIELVRAKNAPTKTADLAINGHDLIEAGILEPGPAMGDCLAYLTNEVLDDPSLNDPDDLFGMAANWAMNWGAK